MSRKMKKKMHKLSLKEEAEETNQFEHNSLQETTNDKIGKKLNYFKQIAHNFSYQKTSI